MGLGLGVPATVSKRRTVVTALFRALKAAVGTHFKAPMVLTGDCELEFLVCSTDDGYEGIAYDSAGSGDSIRFNLGKVQFTPIAGVYILSDTTVANGWLNRVTFKRQGTTYTLKINGQLDKTGSIGTEDIVLDTWGYNGSSYMSGYLPLIQAWVGGDRETGTPYRKYSKFCEPGDVVPNDLAVLGAELRDYATIIADIGAAGFVNNGDNLTYTIYNTWSQRHFKAPISIEAGDTYRLDVDIESAVPMSSLRLTLYYANAETVTPVNWVSNNYYGSYKGLSSGRTSFLVAIPEGADTSNAHVGVGGGDDGEVVTVQITVRKDNDSGQLYNPAEGSDQRYTKSGQTWLGPDIKQLEPGATWQSNPDGSFTHTGAHWGSWLKIGGDAGIRYLADVTVEDQDQIAISSGTGGANVYLSNGRQKRSIPPGAGTPRVGSAPGPTITVHSLKHEIPIAPGAM